MPENEQKYYSVDRSEAFQEILSRNPSWIIRWGSTIFTLVILILIVISYLVQYPDVVKGKITITTTIPPSHVVSEVNGEIAELFVKQGEYIESGNPLYLLDNNLDLDDYIYLKILIDTLSIDSTKLNPVVLPFDLELGDLTKAYMNFSAAYRNYFSSKTYQSTSDELGYLRAEQELQTNILNNLLIQKQNKQKEYELLEDEVSRTVKLYTAGAISKQEFDQVEGKFLQFESDYRDLLNRISTIKIKLDELQKELKVKSLGFGEEQFNFRAELQQAKSNLLAEMQSWENKYYPKAKISGYISMHKYWSANQFVAQGEELLAIVPKETPKHVGRLEVSVDNIGKVKEDLKVLIKLDNYDYKEYGMLEGMVSDISLIPYNGNYLVEVYFPKGLKTNYKRLEYMAEMKGNAEIITKNKRLITRIFENLRALLDDVS